MTPSMLFLAWSSGIAFQCVFHQPVIDGFIVAYFGRLDEQFRIENLFVIPWQAKARCDGADETLWQSLTAPFLASGGSGGQTKRKHVVILMDLGARSAFRSAHGPHCNITFGRAQPSSRKKKGESSKKKEEVWGGYTQEGEEEGLRYCIHIRGHRSSNYPILSGNNLDRHFDILFSRMLGGVDPNFVEFSWMMEKALQPFPDEGDCDTDK